MLPGWMLSSYLAQLAETKAPKAQRLHRIAIRYRAPVHPGDVLDCRAHAGAEELALVMTNQHSKECASGTATFTSA